MTTLVPHNSVFVEDTNNDGIFDIHSGDQVYDQDGLLLSASKALEIDPSLSQKYGFYDQSGQPLSAQLRSQGYVMGFMAGPPPVQNQNLTGLKGRVGPIALVAAGIAAGAWWLFGRDGQHVEVTPGIIIQPLNPTEPFVIPGTTPEIDPDEAVEPAYPDFVIYASGDDGDDPVADDAADNDGDPTDDVAGGPIYNWELDPNDSVDAIAVVVGGALADADPLLLRAIGNPIPPSIDEQSDEEVPLEILEAALAYVSGPVFNVAERSRLSARVAHIYARRGDLEKAFKLYDEAWRLNRDNPDLDYHLILNAMKLADRLEMAEESASLRSEFADVAKATGNYRFAVEAAIDAAERYEALGKESSAGRNYHIAKKIYENHLNHPEAAALAAAEAERLGYRDHHIPDYGLAGDPRIALRDTLSRMRAEGDEPGIAETLMELAALNASRGRWQDAARQFTEAGDHFMGLGDYDQAMTAYQGAYDAYENKSSPHQRAEVRQVLGLLQIINGDLSGLVMVMEAVNLFHSGLDPVRARAMCEVVARLLERFGWNEQAQRTREHIGTLEADRQTWTPEQFNPQD